MRRIFAYLALVLSVAVPAAGQLIGATASGTSISVTVSLPGGIGADVKVGFEEVSGLSLTNLGLSAQLVNPLDPALRARLPSSSVLPALPLLLRIEPPAAGGLSFNGITTLDIHTHNLLYLPGSPLRLYSAPLGGAFNDVTAAMGSGSYRARGNMGGFSEFLIVFDFRSSSQVIGAKFNRLEQLLDTYEASMPGSVYDDLEDLLDDARSAYNGGNKNLAADKLDDFMDLVELHSGTDIPDVWRSARDLQNVAGYLRAGAQTLRFSLKL
jgi:hypothetical protein